MTSYRYFAVLEGNYHFELWALIAIDDCLEYLVDAHFSSYNYFAIGISDMLHLMFDQKNLSIPFL
jgi:hypothetical protein